MFGLCCFYVRVFAIPALRTSYIIYLPELSCQRYVRPNFEQKVLYSTPRANSLFHNLPPQSCSFSSHLAPFPA
jgi:hypothetical protein